MSKTVQVTNGNWNFYTKEDDYNFVYLSFYIGYNDVPFGRNIAVDVPIEIRIPITSWRSIVKDWCDCEWGKDTNLDGTSTVLGRAMKEIINSKKIP